MTWDDFINANTNVTQKDWVAISPLRAEDHRTDALYLCFKTEDDTIIIKDNIKDALTKLAKIAATSLGELKLNKLIKRNRIHTLQSVFWTKNSSYDSDGEIGKAGTIYYPSSVWWFRINGGAPGSTYIMAHEINHTR